MTVSTSLWRVRQRPTAADDEIIGAGPAAGGRPLEAVGAGGNRPTGVAEIGHDRRVTLQRVARRVEASDRRGAVAPQALHRHLVFGGVSSHRDGARQVALIALEVPSESPGE